MTKTQINRRDFLKILGTTGASLVVGIYLSGCDADEVPEVTSKPEISKESPTPHNTAIPTALPAGMLEPNIFIKIDSDNTVTITAFRSEMGQGIRTAIAMIIADELDADWNTVIIKQAPADSAFGDQVTGGSASIQRHYGIMRRAGAVAREMLKSAAAENWGIKASECTTGAGFVIHPDGETKHSYGALAGVASAQEIPNEREAPLKTEDEYRIIGTGVHHWDAPEIITGNAIYGIDVKLPNMLYATMARPRSFGVSLRSFDDSSSMAISGVRHVFEIGNQVAVVAESTWAALKGRAALDVEWSESNNADLSSANIREALAGRVPVLGSANEGRIEAVYEMPFEAHVPMEPMNCTAHLHDGICEVWASTQNPQEARRLVAQYTGIPKDSVTINVPLIGGGFGRRLNADYAVEAAMVSQKIGAPVQVIWTRDDDIQHDYYHPISHHYVSGDPSAPLRPNVRTSSGDSYIPTGAWRSVGEFTTAFPTQSFISELAHAAGQDPLDLWLELYSHSSRATATIELAAEKAGWGEPLPEGWGRGIAYHATFGVTHVAMVMDVEVDSTGNVRVHRVVVAVDCGQVINPNNVAAQMEGGIAFGLTAALKAEITLEKGSVQQNNFNDCPILRIDEMPIVDVHIIESDRAPTGIGEMGVPPVAPAVANAIFAATGKRVRHIPIRADDLLG